MREGSPAQVEATGWLVEGFAGALAATEAATEVAGAGVTSVEAGRAAGAEGADGTWAKASASPVGASRMETREPTPAMSNTRITSRERMRMQP